MRGPHYLLLLFLLISPHLMVIFDELIVGAVHTKPLFGDLSASLATLLNLRPCMLICLFLLCLLQQVFRRVVIVWREPIIHF